MKIKAIFLSIIVTGALMLSFTLDAEAQIVSPDPSLLPSPTPVISPEPNPSPSPVPTLTPDPLPSPLPTPQATPTPDPLPSLTPDSGDVSGQSAPAPPPSPSPSSQPKPVDKPAPKLPPVVEETLEKISGPPLNFLFRENPRPYYYSPNLISPGGSLILTGLGIVFVFLGVTILAANQLETARQTQKLSGVIYL